MKIADSIKKNCTKALRGVKNPIKKYTTQDRNTIPPDSPEQSEEVNHSSNPPILIRNRHQRLRNALRRMFRQTRAEPSSSQGHESETTAPSDARDEEQANLPIEDTMSRSPIISEEELRAESEADSATIHLNNPARSSSTLASTELLGDEMLHEPIDIAAENLETEQSPSNQATQHTGNSTSSLPAH